ncbi:Protein FAM189A2 [Liparis tanakae]|uniref:Protein FAM189A2 n=1 Tax=Liparis tanakae TaxID=230148 RepID=A0A4Z2GN35_9TELE|nr:Protein FAM189A2 [Liparis tanakae]
MWSFGRRQIKTGVALRLAGRPLGEGHGLAGQRDGAAQALNSSDAPSAPSPQTTDSSTQTSHPTLPTCTQGQVTLRRGNNNNNRGGGRTPRRPRPSSMVDYQSYRHTQQLVRSILEQPASQGLAPEVQELVDSIRNVLQSDQEHMEEAVRCASYIEQVITDSQMGPGPPKPPQQPTASHSQTFPRPPRMRRRSCGDLSSFTCDGSADSRRQPELQEKLK